MSTYLIAWAGWDVMQTAAARALTGAAPITGRLPIPLPPWHAIGDGITVRLAATDAPVGVPASAASTAPAARVDQTDARRRVRSGA